MKLGHKFKTEKNKLLEIIGRHLDLSQYDIFFFGSRVKEDKRDDHSDIDVGIEGNEKVPMRILGEIKEEIEKMPILYTIDIVDLDRTSKDFKKEAK